MEASAQDAGRPVRATCVTPHRRSNPRPAAVPAVAIRKNHAATTTARRPVSVRRDDRYKKKKRDSIFDIFGSIMKRDSARR
jgi:hypothetical protein